MLLYYITDRRSIGGETSLLRNIERLGGNIDLLQIREKDLEARELARLTRSVVKVAHPRVRVLVNDRADVAVACGAHGVHLRANALSPATLRRILPAGLVISVSCHNPDDVRRASFERADYALLAPVFQAGKGPSLGLDVLRVACANDVPVLALGGVSSQLIDSCLGAGATGIAGIRLFQSSVSGGDSDARNFLRP